MHGWICNTLHAFNICWNVGYQSWLLMIVSIRQMIKKKERKERKKRSQRKQNSKTHVLVFWNLAFKLSIQNTYHCFRILKHVFWNSAFFGFFSFFPFFPFSWSSVLYWRSLIISFGNPHSSKCWKHGECCKSIHAWPH